MTYKNNRRPTKTDKLLKVLADARWHDTKELVRRVGHTFGGAKFRLTGERYHHDIQKRKHAAKRYQWEYRHFNAALSGPPKSNDRTWN